MGKTAEERYRAKVRVGAAEECWEWTAGRSMGYGTLTIEHWPHRSHRLAWEFNVGPIPEGMEVLHRCDNRLCCNPAHLFLGTKADNMRDAFTKGRQAKGLALPQTKLTEEQAAEIRARSVAGGVKQVDLARDYGVCQQAISYLLRGKNHRETIEREGGPIRRRFLTDAEKVAIRRRYVMGRVTPAQLAEEFDVDQTTISSVIRCVVQR